MPEKKQSERSVKQRAARNIAHQTAGAEPGMSTTLKRGIAMIGAMVAEAVAPTKGYSNKAIEQQYTKRKAAQGVTAKKKGEATKKKKEKRMKGTEKNRRRAEKVTGTGGIRNPLEDVANLAKRKGKGK